MAWLRREPIRVVPIFPVGNAEKLLAYVIKCMPPKDAVIARATRATVTKNRPEPSSATWALMSEGDVLPPRGLAVDSWFEKLARLCLLLLDAELPPVVEGGDYLFDALGTDYQQVALAGTLYRIIVVKSIDHQVPGFATRNARKQWKEKWEAIDRDLIAYVTAVCARKPAPHVNYIRYVTCMFGRCVMCTGPIKEKGGKIAVGLCSAIQGVPIMWHPSCMNTIYVTQLDQPTTNFGSSVGDPMYHRDPASFQKQLFGVRGHVVLASNPDPVSWLYGPTCPHQKELALEYTRQQRPRAHDGRGQIHRCDACLTLLAKSKQKPMDPKNAIARWASTTLVDTVATLSVLPPGEERERVYANYVAAFDAERLETKKASKEAAWRVWKCACREDQAPRFLMAEAKVAAAAGAECLCMRCLCIFDLTRQTLEFSTRRYWCEAAIKKLYK